MAILHKDLTGPDLHEPKGVATAAKGSVYVAEGNGSGTWGRSKASDITVSNTNTQLGADLQTALENLARTESLVESSTEAKPGTVLIPVSHSCEVSQIMMLLSGTLTADNVVTVTRSDGASLGSITLLAAGSAEGTSYEFIPTNNGTLTYPTHKYLKLVLTGGTSDKKVYIQARVRKT